ncbi:VOC family protein [Caldimonas brevitalea]|uniref:Glyoxalase n=1 Tax=Caldimonas brevitalea TaxID=413882 RepID=A0A0G3BS82_9BURK|nr:VOC family protein [Caldimonas brevitalea]AKJ30853.1 glyoxalase [Caldimonas brevitalea]
MKITSYYPVVMTFDVANTVAFYRTHLGFKPLFTADWYVHLQSEEDAAVNLAVVAADHPTVPEPARGRAASGVLLNFEVDDPDAVYARFTAAGLPILLALRDEAFGQRHFITQDPNGVLIDVIKPIPPSAEYAVAYEDGALARITPPATRA